MPPLHQLKIFVAAQCLVGLLGTAVAAWSRGGFAAASFAAGAAVVLWSLVSLAWIAWRVLAQKSVAWTVVAIISKYAIFLSSIYVLTRTAWFDVTAGAVGVASFILAALVGAVFTREKELMRGY